MLRTWLKTNLLLILCILVFAGCGETTPMKSVCEQGHYIHASGYLGDVFVATTDFEQAKEYANGAFFYPGKRCTLEPTEENHD